jgi:hypothetical protein
VHVAVALDEHDGPPAALPSISDPSPTPIPSPATRPELEAAAARGNLTSFNPGDRVYVAHPRLPHGRLHLATITKVVNACIHFTPPIEGLLNDPDDPDAGEWTPTPPHPVQMASATNCVKAEDILMADRLRNLQRSTTEAA